MITHKRIEMDTIEYQKARELRNETLLRPIGIPDYGWEMHDSESFHFAAMDGDSVVGCALLYPLPDSRVDVQLMQMAVAEWMQGKGIGRDIVNELVHFARFRCYHRIVCHSRENVVDFYRKLGFVTYGEPFKEVKILHRHMQLILD